MKRLILSLLVMMSGAVMAHDGPHGPKLLDAPLRGGVMSSVIQDGAEHDHDAPVRYKCEILRSEDGTVRLYFYTAQMVPVPVTRFSKTAKAQLEFKQGQQVIKRMFWLNQRGTVFVGALPKGITRRPYSITVNLTENGRRIQVAFPHLD